jgi:hypothetical protein
MRVYGINAKFQIYHMWCVMQNFQYMTCGVCNHCYKACHFIYSERHRKGEDTKSEHIFVFSCLRFRLLKGEDTNTRNGRTQPPNIAWNTVNIMFISCLKFYFLKKSINHHYYCKLLHLLHLFCMHCVNCILNNYYDVIPLFWPYCM